MRRAANIDRNQPEIVRGLRAVGATVQTLSAVGKGCPDLLVGYGGRNYLLEVKDQDAGASPSHYNLTTPQVDWHRIWLGQVSIVKSVDEALAVLRNGQK